MWGGLQGVLGFPDRREERGVDGETNVEERRVALIGCGGIRWSHIPNILKTPRMRLVTTVGPVEERARAY